MADGEGFIESAKSLSRNPLGIIALFIVLVYAFASIVISLAKPEFYEHPYHPAVVFLATFPIAVLAAFTWLVAYHHRNLYAPSDYTDGKDFFYGLTVPKEVAGDQPAVATSDTSRALTSDDDFRRIGDAYARLKEGRLALVHQAEMLHARTGPGTGRYRVRVWLEPFGRGLDEVASVTYHVWDDFPQPVLATTDAKSSFDLWLTTYGEFPVLALVKLKDGTQLELQRHIDLPGRPRD